MGILVPEYLRRKDHNYFESWARRMGMKPYYRDRSGKHGDILYADSFDLINDPPSVQGYEKFYRTGFCIYRDKAWIASCEEYAPDSFPRLTAAGKQEARVAEAVKYARKYLEQFVKIKLFSPDDTTSFSKLIH